MSVLANVNRDEKRRPKPYTIDDFLLFNDKVTESVASGPVLLDDPNKHTELLIAGMFGGMKIKRAQPQ